MPRKPPRASSGSLGLGQRFALANLAVSAALVMALVVVQTRAAKTAIRERARLGADAALRQAAALCRARLSAGQPTELFDDLQPLVRAQRLVYIDVVDPEGRPLVQVTHPERHRFMTQELARRGDQDDVVIVPLDIDDAGRRLARLEMGIWVRGIQDDLARIELHGVAAGVGLCALLALLSWALGFRLAGRLRRLADDIHRRGPDDFSPLPVAGDDEVARLAAAFNRRQERLHEERARREAAEAHRQDMVHMIVHDMKGPLSVFKSGMPFLKERAAEGGDSRVVKMVEMFAEGSGRLLRMAEGILNVARVEDPDAGIDPKPVDLAALARGRAEGAAVAGRRKGVAIELEAAQGLPHALGDPELLGRVLDNLLLNAVEHAPRGGLVRVGVERRGAALRVAVADNGPGVPAAERARIFDKFRKGRAKSGGVGLGLAFCRLAVERHGGAIGVEDPPKGPGAVFYFSLPVNGRGSGPGRGAGSASSSAS